MIRVCEIAREIEKVFNDGASFNPEENDNDDGYCSFMVNGNFYLLTRLHSDQGEYVFMASTIGKLRFSHVDFNAANKWDLTLPAQEFVEKYVIAGIQQLVKDHESKLEKENNE